MNSHVQHAPSGFHPGETAIHTLLKVPISRQNPTAAGLPRSYAHRVALSPLLALGALDSKGRPWTTLLGGEAGFTQPLGLDADILVAQSLVDAWWNPVVESLIGWEKQTNGCQISHPTELADTSGARRLVSGLSIDPATRDRVKLAGRIVASALGAPGRLSVGEKENKDEAVVQLKMALAIEESLGNCPKYINKRVIRAHFPAPKLLSDGLPLPVEAVELLSKADLFFLSSTDGRSMDTNIRGGPPGFVRVLSNDHKEGGDGIQLVYPEYSGNRLYQTLGNLQVRPLVGICVPDFETSDVLYLTGETEILVGDDAARMLPHTKLALKIRVTSARFVRDGLPFRGDLVDYSPYNPPVRRLAAEMSTLSDAFDAAAKPPAMATLVRREIITPTIGRFTFRLQTCRPLKRWDPGQHVTFNFSSELDQGWSHMRDDDPASLNDDYVRTFTISNVLLPPAADSGDEIEDGTELQVTVRRHGPATGLLWRQNLRAPLELPVLGIGGLEDFRIPLDEREGKEVVFVAAGVGITPLLAQTPGLLASGRKFTLIWSLRQEDSQLAADVFEKNQGLSGRTRIYMTGDIVDEQRIEKLRGLGSEVVWGRLHKEDLSHNTGQGSREYYLCTAPQLLKVLLGWLEGERVFYESFEY